MKFKSEKEAIQAVNSALDGVEKLMKSWAQGDMSKDDGQEPDQIEGQDQESPEDQAQEGVPTEAQEGPHDESQEPAPEGQEGGEGDERAAAEQHAAELSDDELQMMVQILQAEMEKRQASQGQEGAPAAAPEAAPAAPAGNLERSIKAEFSKLAKSFQTEIESLKKSVGALKTENESLKKKMSMPVTKPVSMNGRAVEKKTAAAPEKLNKSETVDYCLNLQRSGNKAINSDLIAAACAVRSEEDLDEVHSRIRYAGIKFPNEK